MRYPLATCKAHCIMYRIPSRSVSVHLIKRSADSGPCIDCILWRGCNEKLNRKKEQPSRLLGGDIFYGIDFLVSKHWAFRYEIYAKRPTLFGIWHATRWHRYGGASRHAQRLECFVQKKMGKFLHLGVCRWFLFSFVLAALASLNAPLTSPSRKHFWPSTCHETCTSIVDNPSPCPE